MNSNYIFLFILDCVRKDHLSLYGYPRKTSLNIDKLAKQSDIYHWAFAPSSYTLASVPSILAGKYPFELSNLFDDSEFTPEDFQNLKELKDQGYKTAMFTANIVTSHHYTNIHKFFDYFWDNLTEQELNRKDIFFQKADKVIKAVKNFIKKNKKKKFFVVIHLMDSHGPYTTWIESIFKNDHFYKKDKRRIDRVINDMLTGANFEILKKYKIAPKYQLLNLIEGINGEIEDFNSNVAEYIAKYDMGIYLQDLALKDFFNFLEVNNIFNQSKIIITADHGELLGEDNLYFLHGSITHPVLTNVPLIIKNPNQKKIKYIKENFNLIDLLTNKKNQIIITHPQDFSFVDDDIYVNIHNSDFSHNGAIYQNLFLTGKLNLKQLLENYQNLNIDFKITYFKKNNKKLIFEKIKRKIDEEIVKVLTNLFFVIKKNFPLIRKKIDFSTKKKSLEKEINNLTQSLIQKDQQIKNLTTQLEKIQSSKTYKLWQGYCRIRDKILRELRVK